jgi:hypothetical protein
LQQREVRAAKERESNRHDFNNVDIHVLLEELHTEGDDDEVVALLLKSREELETELKQW